MLPTAPRNQPRRYAPYAAVPRSQLSTPAQTHAIVRRRALSTGMPLLAPAPNHAPQAGLTPPKPAPRQAPVRWSDGTSMPLDARQAIDVHAQDPFTLESLSQCIALQYKEGLPYVYARMKSALPNSTCVLHGADADALLTFVMRAQDDVIGCNGWDVRIDACNPMNRAHIDDIYFYCFTSPTSPARFVGHLLAMQWDKRQSFVVKTLLQAERQDAQAMLQAAALFRSGTSVAQNTMLARRLEAKAITLGGTQAVLGAQAALLRAYEPKLIEDFFSCGGSANTVLGETPAETALMHTVASGSVSCALLMLAHGGDPDRGADVAFADVLQPLAHTLIAAVDTDKSEVLLACLRHSVLAQGVDLEHSHVLQALWHRARTQQQSAIMQTLQSWTGRLASRSGRALPRPPSQCKVAAVLRQLQAQRLVQTPAPD